VVVAALVSVGLLVPLAALGAGTSSQTASAAQYKVTICHHTHSKKHPTVTIRISNKAWPAHQRHGDTMGACATAKAKHGKSHQNGKSHENGKSHQKGKSHQNSNSHQKGKSHEKGKSSEHAKSGNQTQSPSNAQSGSHANDHASEHAKTHGK